MPNRPDSPRVTVVIPARNEARNLEHLLPRMPAVHEVVLVDGNSSDDTVEVTERFVPEGALKVVHQRGRGKGNAVIEGLLAATGDIVVMIDADCSMDPQEIHAFVGTLRGGADVVKGSRYAAGAGSVDLNLLRSAGNQALNYTARMLYRRRWSELCYGYAAFWADVIPALGLDEFTTSEGRGKLAYGSGFEIEAILFCRAARLGLRVAEVASYEYERIHGVTNLSTFRDGWRVLNAIWKERRYAVPTGRKHRPWQPVTHLTAVTHRHTSPRLVSVPRTAANAEAVAANG